MIRHSVHTLKEGTIEGNTAVARLRLVHRDETHLAFLSAGDEVFAEPGLAAQRLGECCEKGGELLSLRCEAEKTWQISRLRDTEGRVACICKGMAREM